MATNISPHLRPTRTTESRAKQTTCRVLLSLSVILVVFPGFHWAVDSLVTASIYFMGTATFIAASVIYMYFVDRTHESRPVDGATR
ncbi:hypothetical protein EEB13_30495 [Rhodococcus sp. WS3]|uniref:hypothetical protein n=1 Tax=unclassified Rhodococcus (in: high G+C Gram-positive bacteria) TaxID=192944 RepID=UPI0005D42265|nr:MULTISPECIES: hypothetical protein [unclassified Rhodococcus (in: high G+C Gram-positive bacteria)]KJF19255.1 hypothetical protein SZ00_06182 [Rhodococcus sp. AD45]ROZ42778.1 hypothetical protein EEB13_30495 [Rhodococcus sp. WS3]RZL20970.1 MAG: hypothetical protein EOP31_30220 [Rhodococcus sp. (in: high G+C Gram-positive bacteria)]